MVSREIYLPPEIVTTIVKLLQPYREIARYSTINKIWRDAVEREIFSTLKLDLENQDLLQPTLCERRQQYIKQIHLQTWPEGNDEETNSFLDQYSWDHEYTDKHHHLNQERFAAALRSCFDMLSLWKNPHGGGITFDINILAEHPISAEHDSLGRSVRLEPDKDHYITLDPPLGYLPTVQCISAITMSWSEIKISPATWAAILKCLPNLKKIELPFDDDYYISRYSFPTLEDAIRRSRLRNGRSFRRLVPIRHYSELSFSDIKDF